MRIALQLGVKEPIIARLNNPHGVRLLLDGADTKVDEVFIGSRMTSSGHFRTSGEVVDGQSDLPTYP